jgi:hypothetical protein
MRSLACLLLLTLSAAAVEVPSLDYYLPKDANPNPAIPTPKQALGSEFADWHLHHHELIDYLKQIDAKSDRITLSEYARSHGRRPLVYLAITTPENHAKLDSLRQAHLARVTHPEKPLDPTHPAPIVVWMGYGIHGNEPSATHAAALLAYHLASARDRATTDFLKNAIVILDPCLNPDGFERFSSWTNSHRGQHPSAHRSDREHQEGWPNGRPNYYWFDLNRDWLPAVHPESQGRLKLFHDWQPHIVTDYHEMGNVNRTYFFQPGIAKMVNPFTPKANQILTEKMAQEHARALDAIGSLYYTGESFDDFYIGKGSTYPDVNGSVGVLFEQASSRGFHTNTEHGLLTFPFTIRNQFTTSLSTLRAAHTHRADFIAYQQTFFQDALKEAAASKTKSHVFTAPGDPARLEAFQTLLTRHQIQSHRPAANVTAGTQTFPASTSLIVPVQQRQFRLLSAMFETRTKFESSTFYDVSAWHLPSAFGLLHTPLESVPAPAATPLIKAKGSLAGPENASAYVFSWTPRHAPTALFALLNANVRCWTATRSFTTTTAGKKSHWPQGSILIPVATQETIKPDALRHLIQSLAQQNTLPIQALSTAYNGSVPDLGSPTFQPLSKRNVLLLTGPSVTSTTAGDVWFQFDQVWHSPLTRVEPPQLTSSLLRDFSTVILPGASFSTLPSTAQSALQSWVKSGGCLIGIGSSAASLASQDWCKIELAKTTVDSGPKNNDKDKAKPKPPTSPEPYDQASERRTEKELNGVIVAASFDPTHPHAFGFTGRPQIQLMRDGTTFLKPASSPYLNPLRYTNTPLVSGSASQANQNLMKGTTPLQIKPVDAGHVILFTDNPVFRGHWLGSEKLLANALFFGPLIKTAGSDADDEL